MPSFLRRRTTLPSSTSVFVDGTRALHRRWLKLRHGCHDKTKTAARAVAGFDICARVKRVVGYGFDDSRAHSHHAG
jgi:hypothetical protein